MQDPAGGAVGVAHLAPALEFLDDLERQAGAAVDPGGGVIGAGALAQVDPVGLEADEARHRQAAAAGKAGAAFSDRAPAAAVSAAANANSAISARGKPARYSLAHPVFPSLATPHTQDLSVENHRNIIKSPPQGSRAPAHAESKIPHFVIAMTFC